MGVKVRSYLVVSQAQSDTESPTELKTQTGGTKPASHRTPISLRDRAGGVSLQAVMLRLTWVKMHLRPRFWQTALLFGRLFSPLSAACAAVLLWFCVLGLVWFAVCFLNSIKLNKTIQ